MTGATGNIYAGLHEFADMAFTLHFLRPDDLFLDVGANIGSYTLLASGVCNARTISFEPDPETMTLLRRNIGLNGLHERFVLEQAAIGAEEGEVEFTIGLDTCNHVTTGKEERTQRVSIRTLDSIASVTPATMIKVDVEGYEADVFQGARAMLNSPLLKVVITEGQRPADSCRWRVLALLSTYTIHFSEGLAALLGAGLVTTRYLFVIHRSLRRD